MDIHLKLSKGDDYFIFTVNGLNEDEILDLVKQSMDLGYSIVASDEKEFSSISDMPYLAQIRMEKCFLEWDKLIDWNNLIQN